VIVQGVYDGDKFFWIVCGGKLGGVHDDGQFK
jgi:hypothetical protein